MPNFSLLPCRPFDSGAVQSSIFHVRPLSVFSMLHHRTSRTSQLHVIKSNLPYVSRNFNLERPRGHTVQSVNDNIVSSVDEEEYSMIDEDDEICPVDCVSEFKTDEEFCTILEKAKKSDSLVLVDFYRNSCGSCKYIETGFIKLCKGSGDQEGQIIFLKHNVMDEYDEQTEVAERLRIRSVPLFQFYKDGVLLEAFPTRDKDRVLATIRKYSSVNL
ncbi:thioredoxin superfamily protein [Wolffia australiana]